MPVGEESPLKRGHQREVPPLEIVILPLGSSSVETVADAVDTDLLRIITSTADELSSGTKHR